MAFSDEKRKAFAKHPRIHKRGDTREDGKVFFEYNIGSKGFEHWVDPEVIENKKKYLSAYNKRNREKHNQWQRDRARELRSTSPKWKATKNVRGRIYQAFKCGGYTKNTKTQKMLGCSFDFLKEHLEKQFVDGMSWDNYGRDGWHIDHIIPLASAETQEEMEDLCHYSNLQPLWGVENMQKGSRY